MNTVFPVSSARCRTGSWARSGLAFTTRAACHTARDHQVLGDGGSYGLFGRAFLQRDVGVHAAVLGPERIANIISEQHPPTASAADFAVLAYPQAVGEANALCHRLRLAGIRVWDQTIRQPIRRHLRELAHLGIPASTIIGDRERAFAFAAGAPH